MLLRLSSSWPACLRPPYTIHFFVHKTVQKNERDKGTPFLYKHRRPPMFQFYMYYLSSCYTLLIGALEDSEP